MPSRQVTPNFGNCLLTLLRIAVKYGYYEEVRPKENRTQVGRLRPDASRDYGGLNKNSMQRYDPKKIERKWQQFWEKEKTFEVKEDSKKQKFYSLIEFPYPSGAGLHVGHPRPFTAMDVISRKKRMEGYNVLYPIGFDAFGLPTENYAIKTGRPPAEVTAENIATFTRQLKSLGYSFDWSRSVDTTDPKYYKWTQWIFLQFFKHGLAYKKNQPINWCPKDKIGLANEEVVNGCCERCGTPVEKRNKEQWMLAITKYADKLLEGLKEVDYIPQARIQQENWIGRSEGATVRFKIKDLRLKNEKSPLEGGAPQGMAGGVGQFVEVFTTRPDTIFGATFVAVSAELAKSWLDVGWQASEEVKKYVEKTLAEQKTLDREEKEKTGVDAGIKAVNPATKEEIPVWITNYVMGGVGTGAIMAVPAHDERDFEFAKKYGLPIKQVVLPVPLYQAGQREGSAVVQEAFTDEGVNVDSGFLNLSPTKFAKETMLDWLEEYGYGKRQVNYKLRDWVFSRQRYWGEPIPLVYCEACKNRKYNYIIIHGYGSTSKRGFKPWLKMELEKQGHQVWNPDLPNTDEPNVDEQVQFILDNAPFAIDENTIVTGHSLGGAVVYKLLEKIKKKIAKAILVDPVFKPEYNDNPRPAVEKSTDWKFDWKKIKSKAEEFVILGDKNFPIIKEEHLRELTSILDGNLQLVNPNVPHFSSTDKQDGSVTVEPHVLETSVSSGWIHLPADQLPLKLPKVEKYQPTDTGESPLAAMTDWVKTTCPKCGGPARRETDTMPNWAGSSWYFLRYVDPYNDKEFASKEKLEYWMGHKTVIPTTKEESLSQPPNGQRSFAAAQDDKQGDKFLGGVDWYNGGMEHTVLHLLYSRFWNQFLYDIGLVPTREPYKKRTSHGMILAEDGQKMSKSLGNVVNPDEMVEKFGADAFRMYIMFMGPFDQAVKWDTNGLVGVRRFLDRVWSLQEKVASDDSLNFQFSISNFQSKLHQTIRKVTEDIDAMRFNTAIAALMELTNEMMKEEHVSRNTYQIFIKLLSPFAPHIAEELWSVYGANDRVQDIEPLPYAAWPQYDPELAKEEKITIAIQVNGKVRDQIEVGAETGEDEVKNLVLASEKIQKWLEGKELKKVIYVKGKLVSIVV